MNEQETLRLKSLELAVQHLSKDAHNLETVLQWADKFYEWLTRDSKASEAHTADPQAPDSSKDMVSKKDLGELLIAMLCNNYGRKQVLTQAQIIGYNAAVNDTLDALNKMP